MEIKLFEVRDRNGARIPCFGILLQSGSESEQNLLREAGYISEPECKSLLFGELDFNCGELDFGCYERWPDNWSTFSPMRYAHRHVLKNWEKLESGEVIDVEAIKASERLS